MGHLEAGHHPEQFRYGRKPASPDVFLGDYIDGSVGIGHLFLCLGHRGDFKGRQLGYGEVFKIKEMVILFRGMAYGLNCQPCKHRKEYPTNSPKNFPVHILGTKSGFLKKVFYFIKKGPGVYWFTDVPVTTNLPGLFLVSIHSVGCDCNYGYMACKGITLEY